MVPSSGVLQGASWVDPPEGVLENPGAPEVAACRGALKPGFVKGRVCQVVAAFLSPLL